MAATAEPITNAPDWTFESLTRREGHATGVLGPLWVAVWNSAPMPEDLRTARTTLEALAEAHDGFAYALCVFCSGAPLMPMGLRMLAIEVTCALAPLIRRSAVVVEGEGLWASAMVSLVTHIVLPARMTQLRIVRKVPESVAWLSPDSGLLPASIEHACATLRAAAGGR